jgi:hypothetical protein
MGRSQSRRSPFLSQYASQTMQLGHRELVRVYQRLDLQQIRKRAAGCLLLLGELISRPASKSCVDFFPGKIQPPQQRYAGGTESAAPSSGDWLAGDEHPPSTNIAAKAVSLATYIQPWPETQGVPSRSVAF